MNTAPVPPLAFDPRAIWQDHGPTGLVALPALARRVGVGQVLVKLEHQRPLGNFKSLGGFCAGLRALARHAGLPTLQALALHRGALPPLLCASEGNHGLAVAAAARHAGSRARVYLPRQVSPLRVARIQAHGAQVVPVDGTYDDAVDAAREAAASGAGLLVPDTSADPDDVAVADVLDGYAVIAGELRQQFQGSTHRPTHAFVQAGVGGLAAAMAQGLAGHWSGPGRLLAVEPLRAACVARALGHATAERIAGDLATTATMLACGVASAAAIRTLRMHGARALAVDDARLAQAVDALLQAGGPATTPSGAAGLAGLLHVADEPALRADHGLRGDSRVLLLVTEAALEGPVEPPWGGRF